MSFHISRSVGWGSNYNPVISDYSTFKYFFFIDVDVDCTSVSGNTATIRVHGTYRIVNSAAGGPPNRVGAASDFAVLAGGSWAQSAHAFDPNHDYYMANLPMIPNAGSDLLYNKLLLEFRGDTYTYTGNHSTVYTKGGTINPNYDGSTFDRTYSIDKTFTIEVPTVGNVNLITWTTSGWGMPHEYEWLTQETWASWFDLRWTARVKYNANGGSNAPADSTAFGAGTTLGVVLSNSRPTRTNYRFKGWSTTSGGSAQYQPGDTVFVAQATPTITLYAVWEAYYKPGQRKISGTWRSHNRSGGVCNRKGYGEMWTIAGGVETTDPPSRKSSNTWYNMKKIGAE